MIARERIDAVKLKIRPSIRLSVRLSGRSSQKVSLLRPRQNLVVPTERFLGRTASIASGIADSMAPAAAVARPGMAVAALAIFGIVGKISRSAARCPRALSRREFRLN